MVSWPSCWYCGPIDTLSYLLDVCSMSSSILLCSMSSRSPVGCDGCTQVERSDSIEVFSDWSRGSSAWSAKSDEWFTWYVLAWCCLTCKLFSDVRCLVFRIWLPATAMCLILNARGTFVFWWLLAAVCSSEVSLDSGVVAGAGGQSPPSEF